MTFPLVFVRSWSVYRVPEVPTIAWRDEDWKKVEHRVAEPLVLDGAFGTWLATGERNERGHLLYRKAEAR